MVSSSTHCCVCSYALQPPKTYCCRDLNPDFLAQRKEKLQKFLQDLLATPGLPEEEDVRAFLLLQSSEALYI